MYHRLARITYNNVSMWKNHLFPENHDRSTYGASRNARNLARIPPSFLVSEAGIKPREGKKNLRSMGGVKQKRGEKSDSVTISIGYYGV